jgi:hypothetical protein
MVGPDHDLVDAMVLERQHSSVGTRYAVERKMHRDTIIY